MCLHTGPADIAVAEYTLDADLAIDPDLLSNDPLIGGALRDANFTPDSDQGRWLTDKGVYLDLLVPEGVARNRGRRSVDLGEHGHHIARWAAGLEPVLEDNEEMIIQSRPNSSVLPRRVRAVDAEGGLKLLPCSESIDP